MDTLSALVQMLAPSGTVDLRCRIAAPWTAAQSAAPAGHIPYHVILQGEAHIDRAGGPIRLRPGDIVSFPHGAAHYIHFSGGARGRAAVARTETSFNGVLNEVTLAADAALLEPSLDMLCGTFVLGAPGMALLRTLPGVMKVGTSDENDSGWLRSLIAMIRAEAEVPQPGGAAIITELSTALFTILLRTVIARGGLSQSVLALMADARVSKAIHAVITAPEQSWTIDKLAAIASMSRPTLARRFADLGGMTPLEFVTRLRMERAASMLADGRLPIANVGEACGYSSPAAFSRIFKQQFGVVPRVYRQQSERAVGR
ncbi:cupin domain-containing protein [Cupriavidus sp. CP313]